MVKPTSPPTPTGPVTPTGPATSTGPAWPTVVALFALGWVVLYAGRTVLSPALTSIGAEWHLDQAQLGLIASVFFLAYAAMQIPTGILADRFGRRGLLVVGFGLFAAATLLRGLAPTYALFVMAGGLAGLGQGTYYATQFAISSEALPRERRSFGSAVIYSGMAVGTSLGLILAGWAIFGLGWGWRAPFLAISAPALVMVILFARTLRERGVPAAAGGAAVPGPRAAIRSALTPTLLAAYVLNFTSLYAFFMLLAWLPYYLEVERGFSGALAGLVASLVPWASIPAGLLVSSLSDRWNSRIGPLRVLLPVAALAVAGLAVVESRIALFGLLILYGLSGKSTVDPLLTALVADAAPAERSATALGFLNFAGMVASVLAPYLTGLIARATGSMGPALYLAAVVLIGGFVLSLALARPSALAPGRRSTSA